ncbi:type II toxin-antitoxin system HicB family antitoxin [Oceanicoccus sagamiensis]|uniref:HicB-like antitoxin of toxin-antitoxin system domain-containing protein n=1 Tax=Oceanicoccus sagamiensis TaxID=716816 RepID=A0A1X9NG04_9GAMM|nr:type II toxin-antitoxin system HicB family antitoxin [Oceanicoccus sagamiensis]ARN75332.1 hypothetical protein BST96_15150 [Oceanicoccus sagamiensis]
MKYPVVIHHEEGSAFGLTVPDIPGCFSTGDSFDEAFDNAQEAIKDHLAILAEEGASIPAASPIAEHMDNQDFADGVWGFVVIDISPYLGKTEKINVTLPTAMIHKIDAKYQNRSKFLAEAALAALA